MPLNINDIQEKLKNNGYKFTNQRKAIIDVLIEEKGRFLTAEDIFIKSKDKYNNTNFSTVYRNLIILEKLEIIHITNSENNVALYEIIDIDNHHHHIICKNCGKSEAIDFCPFKYLAENFNSSFTFTDHKFEIYGYCIECQNKKCKKK